jgi:hypothetical protein
LEEEYSFIFKYSEIGFWMVILILVLYLIILIIEFSYKIRIGLIRISLFFLIIIRDFLSFFLLYEIVFILIIFSIVLLGYRFERLMASFLILFYSFLFSSPVLIMLIVFDYRFIIKE